MICYSLCSARFLRFERISFLVKCKNMDERSFTNSFKDCEHGNFLDKDGKLCQEYADKITAKRNELLEIVKREVGNDKNYSVYTGDAGISLLYLRLYELSKNKEDQAHLHTALGYIERPLRHLKGRKLTFMCGDAGPLSIGAVVYFLLGRDAEYKKCMKSLLDFSEAVLYDEDIPDELFNGRVGYLYALLFVQKRISKEIIDKTLITKVVKAVLESGTSLSKSGKWNQPLMYQWHEKPYLGAAHGLAGILFILMQVFEGDLKKEYEKLVKPTIEFMLSLQFPSGNGPSSIGSPNGDKLVHWCHGAPGWIYMFIQAYKVFSDERYLDAALRCADVIWSRGLLKKGYGLCHGTAGNGYGFLAMFQLTGDQKYLHRAIKFADWCCDYGKHGCRTPDTPFSLFEGMAGTVYFLADVIDPKSSAFPAFEI